MPDYDVELTHVNKIFDAVQAVDDVSFQVERGKFFSLLGPSGCGKTTIMRMISGFETPTSGSIAIRGRNISNTPPHLRPTNLVFQHLALFPHMTVAKNIAFGLEMNKVDKHIIDRKVGEMLEIVDLAGFGARKISQISGGQKQRIAIARALVNEPAVLLLDEPLGALDLKLREQMQLELKRIQREVGTTFIYVTHDQNEAITMSDQIAVINRGKIEQLGTADAIYERPASAFVANFIGETNLLSGVVSECHGKEALVSVQGIAIKVVVDQPLAAGTSLYVSIRPEKIHFDTMSGADMNTFTGTVAEITYMGSHTRYKVLTGHDLALDVDVQNSRRTAFLDPGAHVSIQWQTEMAVALAHPA